MQVSRGMRERLASARSVPALAAWGRQLASFASGLWDVLGGAGVVDVAGRTAVMELVSVIALHAALVSGHTLSSLHLPLQ